MYQISPSYQSWFSRETEPTVCIVTYNCGRWWVSRSVVSKLETQESQCLVPVWVQRPDQQENWWYSPSPKAGWLETQEESTFQLKPESKEKKKKSSQPACSQTEEFFLHWGYSFFPSVLVLFGWSLDTLGRAVCFTGSVNLNVKLLQKHPCSNAQNNVWPNIWVPRGLVELAREVNSYSHILRFRVDMNFGRHYYAI